MKPCIGCLPIGLLLLASSLVHGQSARTETPQIGISEIARLEDRWLKAIEVADIATLNSILADDFIRPVPAASQFITKSQLLDYYKLHKPASSAPKHIENLNITFYGTTAIARGNVVTEGPVGGMASRNLFTDVFVYRNDHWQAISAQENDATTH